MHLSISECTYNLHQIQNIEDEIVSYMLCPNFDAFSVC